MVIGSRWSVTGCRRPDGGEGGKIKFKIKIKLKMKRNDGSWETGRGGGGRRLTHDGKIIRESMDCKCKCIVITNIRYSYLSFGLEVGGRREVEKLHERQQERERGMKKAVNKGSYEVGF